MSKVTDEQVQSYLRLCTVDFYNPEGSTLTICSVFLPNGFNLAIGTASCVAKANFNKDIGEQIALNKAMALAEDKLWELLGWELKQKLFPID